MISDIKYDKLLSVLKKCNRHFLNSECGRRQVGSLLANKIEMFPGRVYDFLDEMEGLDLYNEEDWAVFLQFLKYSL